MEFFGKAGFSSHGVYNVTSPECYDLCRNGAAIVDVREKYLTEFKTFDVGNVIYLPFSSLKDSLAGLPYDIPLIFADSTGLLSRESFIIASGAGYINIANLPGGISDWERAGFPVKIDFSRALSGSCLCQLRYRGGRKE